MAPNQLRLRAPGFKDFRRKPLGPCSGYKVKRHGFSLLFCFFFFLSFSFGRLHWPYFLGTHNLLQVVNETRVGLQDEGVM